MRTVYALTLRGEKPPIHEWEWASTRIWVTKRQMAQIMKDQDDPNRKGRIYWVGQRFFGLKDLSYAMPYDYDQPTVRAHLSYADYLKKQLELEAKANG